jgi:hypothetical protein
MKVLPATGTAAFLETLSPHIPDDLIDSLFAHRSTRGRPHLLTFAVVSHQPAAPADAGPFV